MIFYPINYRLLKKWIQANELLLHSTEYFEKGMIKNVGINKA